ncbi:MAG: hypothetical protein U0359_29515 [Byssovorax sp.]
MIRPLREKNAGAHARRATRRAALALFFALPLLGAAGSCTGGPASPGATGIATAHPRATAILAGSRPLTQGRSGHTATLLPDGMILLAGGRPDEASKGRTAEVYDPATGRSRATFAPMATARSGHTATLLRSGMVLLAGGISSLDTSAGEAARSAEIYDPGTDRFRSVAVPLRAPRANHTATLLPDGKVLLAGGRAGFAEDGDPMSNTLDPGPDGAPWAEIFDPETETFEATPGPMVELRSHHTATLLADGRVLLAGGEDDPDGPAHVGRSAEIFDPKSGAFTATAGHPLRDFSHHTATALPGGQVLLTGGLARPLPDGGRDESEQLREAELYDPGKDEFIATGSLARFRADHSATLLPSGRVLVTGGLEDAGGSLEVYDPPSGAFLPIEDLPAPRRGGHSATLLPSGAVLIAGGTTLALNEPVASSDTLLYDDGSGAVRPLADAQVSRVFHSSTLLLDGTVLLAGGTVSSESGFFPGAEIYAPGDGDVRPTKGQLHNLRANHAATLLATGEVLLTGGLDQSMPDGDPAGGALRTAETYAPEAGTFTLTSPLHEARVSHTATLLASGEVLVAGGSSGLSSGLQTAELFDPLPRLFYAIPAPMESPRTLHAAARLRSGEVLIAGGYWGADALRTAEIYDPVSRSFRATGMMASPHASSVVSTFSATLLASGKVLIVGYDAAELFDPEADGGAGAFSPAAAGHDEAAHRNGHTATLLPSGKVLIAGGTDQAGAPLASSALYDPMTDRFIDLPSLGRARAFHAATLLPDGRAFISGGYDNDGVVSLFEAWDEGLPGGLPRPRITGVARAPGGERTQVSGDHFIGPIETGSGASSSSAVNLPLALFLPAGGGLTTGILRDITPGSASWFFPAERLTGPGLLFLSAGTRRSEGVPLALGQDRACRSTADCPAGLTCSSEGACTAPVTSGPPAEGCAVGGRAATSSRVAPTVLALGLLGLAIRAISRRAPRPGCRARGRGTPPHRRSPRSPR